MNEILNFFKRYTKSIGASNTTKKNSLMIAGALLRHDPFGKTKFEVSFKIKKHILPRRIRFLNMDGNAYSSKNKLFFLERLEIYKRIMNGKINNSLLPRVIQALTEISKTPMDLYFGADIENNNYLFAFWLIFGGVKKTGEVSFWNYDFDGIVKNALEKMRFKPPRFLRKDILNLGFDIDNNNVFYKLYYLLRDKTEYLSPFTNLMKKINRTLPDFKYFYFFSRMYDEQGRCCKQKLFTEFLEDIYPDTEKTNELLAKVLTLNNNHIELQRLLKIIKLIDGRISLMSFEADGTITFYIRPN
jgi:hypothetical protein